MSRKGVSKDSARRPLFGLTNFSAETYPPTVARFELLSWLRGVVVSGEVGVIKPNPRIYEIAPNALRSIRIARSTSTMWRSMLRPLFVLAFTAFILPPPNCCTSS
jgi:FMN phosphatase YigB (HAD superfamily)